jgi:hypothetical protein
MRTDAIAAIGIDEDGSLWVKPATATFPFIYREAMDVKWDAERLRLSAPSHGNGRMRRGSSRFEMQPGNRESS